MNKEFFINNRKEVIDFMEDNSAVVLFSGEAPKRSYDGRYHYTPNRNFYYLVGTKRENFILMITKYHGEVNQVLYIEEPNPDIEKWIGIKMRKEEAKEISGIEDIRYTNQFESQFARMLLSDSYKNLYLDLERQSLEDADSKAEQFAKEMKEKAAYLNIKDVNEKVGYMRMFKKPEEVENMRKAVDMTRAGLEDVMKNLKPGMMEYQAEAYFDFRIKTMGAEDNAFNTIVASGKNAPVLHYEENDSEIEDGTLVLFDLGAQYSCYSADISRTYPANGKFTERQKELYNIVLKAMNETIDMMKPGVLFVDLNKKTRSVLIEECKKINLIKEDSEIDKYYYHGVSHYLGLDTHDIGDRRAKLEEGMVLTVEPGLYIADEKIGIRIEDDILITKEGHENLSRDIIKTVEEIEAFMAR